MVFKVELGAINTGLLSPQPMLPDLSGFPESTVELRPRPVHATLSKTCHMAISGSDSSPRRGSFFRTPPSEESGYRSFTRPQNTCFGDLSGSAHTAGLSCHAQTSLCEPTPWLQSVSIYEFTLLRPLQASSRRISDT